MAASCRRTQVEEGQRMCHYKNVRRVKSEATAYLGEGFLWISKKWSLPGEQTSALYSHSHVRQLELNNVKNTRLDLKRSRFIKKVFIQFISSFHSSYLRHEIFSISCFSNVKLCCFSLFHVTVNWISLTSESLCDVFKWKLWWTFFKIIWDEIRLYLLIGEIIEMS